MITAVDTSVLIDVFAADPEFGPRSRDALRSCVQKSRLVACDVVWAEVVAGFPDATIGADALRRLGVRLVPLDECASEAAGAVWRAYRERRGGRGRVMADFLIGAHAAVLADRLLTRDRGFYRTCFDNLTLVEPTSLPR